MEDNRRFLKIVCECYYENQFTNLPPCSGNVELRSSMTAYDFNGVKNSPEDPNRPFWYCDYHYGNYVDYWQDMWSNVPRG